MGNRRRMTRQEYFWRQVDIPPDVGTGCWLWTDAIKGEYGVFSKKPQWVAHRFAFTEVRGPIPPGMTLDHTCRNRRCVNPAHMDVCTRAENLRRTFPFRAVNITCPQGHRLDIDVTTGSVGFVGSHRRCLVCVRLSWQKTNKRRNRERAAARLMGDFRKI